MGLGVKFYPHTQKLCAQSHFSFALGLVAGTGLPLSKTTLHRLGPSSRQMELKMLTMVPAGFRTGPLLRAKVPEDSTSTISGSQEKGASTEVKYLDQYATIASFPRNGVNVVKKIASSDNHEAKALRSRSAMDLANARSAFMTSCRASSSVLTFFIDMSLVKLTLFKFIMAQTGRPALHSRRPVEFPVFVCVWLNFNSSFTRWSYT